MDNQLISACMHALKQNLALKSHESVLVVTDKHKRAIGQAFQKAALQVTNHVETIEIPIPEFNGQEPADFAGEKMRQADVVVMPLTKSLSWTKARRAATDAGARIASMARITEDILLRSFPVDYHKIRQRANALADLLDPACRVRIITELGTDLSINITNRKAHGRSGGMYTQKGKWGNLPCGEAFIAPAQEGTNGIYFVDASHASIGALSQPIKITVEDGFAKGIEGGDAAKILQQELASAGDPNAYNIAEFGIGCNDKAQICGITLEDEKVLGTCHLALGSNILFGGDVEVGIHIDGVIKAPTIFIDKHKILENGNLQIE